VKSRQGEMYCVSCEMEVHILTQVLHLVTLCKYTRALTVENSCQVKRESTLDMTVTSSPLKTAVQTPGSSGTHSEKSHLY
jgi:hypothetical protein